MTGEKLLSVKALVLTDQADKAFAAGDIGMVILSGPNLYLNNGSSWQLVTLG